MANWYFVTSKTREKSGPHEEAFVRAKFVAGEIAPNTLVWHDGLANWIPAHQAFTAPKPLAPETKVPLPDALCGWMTFVGVVTILSSIFPSFFLWGLPFLFSGIVLLGARNALNRTPLISAEMLPFFAKLQTFFCIWGWIYIFSIILFVFFFLLALSTILLPLSKISC